MSKDILVRLQLSGESLSQEVDAALAPLQQKAEQAGQSAGRGLAQGVKAASSEIAGAVAESTRAFTAEDAALQRFNPLAMEYAAAKSRMGAETDRLRLAVKAGEITQEQFTLAQLESRLALKASAVEMRAAESAYLSTIRATQQASRSLNSLADVHRAGAVSSGQNRAAMQQLSYQLGDISTMYAMGARPMQIFASQSGQVLQAVQLMSGGTSRLAGFLAGPWGMAITSAAVVMGSLIGATQDEEEAITSLDRAFDFAAMSADQLRQVNELLSDSNREVAATAIQAAQAMGARAQANATTAAADLRSAELELSQLNAVWDASARAGVIPDTSQMERTSARMAELQTIIPGLRREVRSAAADVALMTSALSDNEAEVERLTAMQNNLRNAYVETGQTGFLQAAEALTPSIQAAGETTERATGSTARASQSQQVRDAADAIRERERAQQAFEQAVQRTLEAQSDSVRVEEVRSQLGEAAAAAEEARLGFQRQNPLAVHQTAVALATALGITRQLTEAEEAHYDNLIASADAAENSAAASAQRAVEQREADARAAKQQQAVEDTKAANIAAIEEARAAQEDAVRDVADLYESLFTGSNGSIWKDFKAQGLSIVSEIAAQWTLALLSGQSGGGVAGVIAGAGGGAGGNPLSSLFNLGSLFGGNPATKPGAAAPAAGLGDIAAMLGLGSKAGSGTAMNPIASAIASVPGLNVAIAAAAVTHVVGEGLEKLTGVRFDALGGLFGGLIGGFAVGALKGAVKGNATIGADGSQLGIVDQFGKKKFRDQAVNDATGIMDMLAQLADGLGVDMNAAAGAVSIGTRNGKYRVDPSGTGVLKTGLGAVDFGKDQEAAIEYAVRNLIEDGVLGPISQASKNILLAGGDLQQAIEKAVLIESVPKLLKQRLNPLGAALDEIDEQFRKLAEAMKEGGASAEQIAQARQLWQLERADAIKQIAEASKGLKDYLASLNAGPDSPLSLRQQQAEAEKALAPFVASIEEAKAAKAEVDRLKASGGSAAEISAAEEAARAAAARIDQNGTQEAVQSLLGITRQIEASGAGFFAVFDRVNNLLGGAIGAIDAAAGTPGSGTDPFTELTARNTGDMAAMMADHTRLLVESNSLLVALNDNFANTGPEVGSKAWLKQQRKLTSVG